MPLEQRRFLPQRQHDGSEQLGLSEQAPELQLPGLRRRAAGAGILGELAKAGDQRAASLPHGLDLGAGLLNEVIGAMRELPERAPRAVECQQTICEGPDADGRRPGSRRHDRRRAGPRRAQLRHGVAKGLDLIGDIGRTVVGRPIDLGKLRDELQLDPPELESIGRGGQLPIERGPRSRGRGARLRPQPRDVALLALDRGPELRAPVGARRRPRRGRLMRLGRAGLIQDRRAGAGGVEGAEQGALRRLFLAPVGVGVEGAPEPLHDDPRLLVPGECPLKRRHHRFRRHDGMGSGRRVLLLSEGAPLGPQERHQREQARDGICLATCHLHPLCGAAHDCLVGVRRRAADLVRPLSGSGCKVTATAPVRAIFCRGGDTLSGEPEPRPRIARGTGLATSGVR